jgi:hypothetical protein
MAVLAYFHYFEKKNKIKLGLWNHLAVGVYLCIHLINISMPEPIFLNLGMYIMAPEPISVA